MKTNRVLVLALIAGLLLGSISVAEAKKKKKKKPTSVPATSTFFLRHESDECSDKEKFTLSLTDGEDYDCQYAVNLAGAAAGYVPDTYTASDGVPFKLDATEDITGVISIRSYLPPANVGAGLASVTVQLSGTVDGEEEEVVLGEWSIEYTAMPGTVHTFEYEIDVDDALSEKEFTSLSATVAPGGTTVGLHGVIEHDEPPSLINVPTLIEEK